MSKKKIQMIPTGYIPPNPGYGYANDHWGWGSINDSLCQNSSQNARLGGWTCSYSEYKAGKSNVGSNETCVLENGVITERAFSGTPLHPGHEDAGTGKTYGCENPRGWAYQAKLDNSNFGSHKGKVMKLFQSGTNDNGRAYAWSAFYNSVADLKYLDGASNVNDDCRKSFWMSSLLVRKQYNMARCHMSGYSGEAISGAFRDQVTDVNKVTAPRAKNVVGFSINVYCDGTNDTCGFYPHTISLIMQPYNDNRYVVVVPTEKGNGAMRLAQKWADWDSDEQHIKSFHKYENPQWSENKKTVLHYTYTCNTADINTIIQKRMVLVGVNFKLVKVGKGGGLTLRSGQCYLWNFKPICCDDSGSVSTTWNTGKYNVWPYSDHTQQRARKKFRLSYV